MLDRRRAHSSGGATAAPGRALDADSRRRIAVVHEARSRLGGPGDVVAHLCAMWPQVELFPAGPEPDEPAGPRVRRAVARFRCGDGRRRHLLELVPAHVPAVDLGGFDAVVTVHRAFAHRVCPPDGVPTVSYVHTPACWMWDPRMREHECSGRVGRLALDAYASRQRGRDRAAAERPDVLVAPSRAVAARIQAWWNRTAEVVPPPVDVDWYRPAARGTREDFYLYAGRLEPCRRPEVAVAAARAAGVRLVVAGEGRSRAALEQMAGHRAEFVGRVGRKELRELYRRCAAVVVPGEPDFGRASVEAQACGTPVLALGAGGSVDTVVDGVTGRLWHPRYDGTAVGSLAHELRLFDPGRYDPGQLRRHAEGFAPGHFRRDLQAIVERAVSSADAPGEPAVRGERAPARRDLLMPGERRVADRPDTIVIRRT